MAKVRPPLTEDDLRFTWDDLMTRTTDMHRAAGKLPDVKAAEGFLRPILDKTIHTHEEDRRKDLVRVDPRQAQAEAVATSRRKRIASLVPDGWKLFSEDAGELEWDLGKNKITGSAVPAQPVETPGIAAARKRFKFLLTIKEWRERIDSVMFGPLPGPAKEQAYWKILGDSCRLYDNPMLTGDAELKAAAALGAK